MHEKYMLEAIKEARKAYLVDEVPVGAIIVYKDEIIARAHNLRETQQSPIAHAEILAIKEASKRLGTWKLNECILYVTLEPCIMCAGTCVQSRIGTIVYGANDQKGGSFGSTVDLSAIKDFNHYPRVIKGVLEEVCSDLLKEYFREKRERQLKIKKINTEDELKKVLNLRNEVFVQEQNVDPEIEYDEYDTIHRKDVIHFGAYIENEIVGTFRLILEDKTVKVGRVAVSKRARGKNCGLRMMQQADVFALNNGYKELVLGAQEYAIPFYEKCGYEAYGEIFLDADIRHKMMKKKV